MMNTSAPPHDLEMAYVRLEVPDPSALDAFFGEVIGLVPGAPTASGDATWRNDSKAHRVVVGRGDANDAVTIGLEASDDATLDEVRARLDAAGYSTEDGTANDCAARRVKRLVRVPSPWGVDVEIVTGLADDASPFHSPLMPGGFHTTGVGFGHVVFATTNFDESHRFVVDGLGLAQSDWLEMELAPGIDLEVRFYHCNERHHSVALARAPFDLPQHLHHIMFETVERDDVGAAFDRAWSTDLAITNGLGMHDNDRMFSFYVAAPAGFQVEVGHGARVITEPWFDNRRYDRISLWGHQPLRSSTGASS